jgi:hypothetical protein
MQRYVVRLTHHVEGLSVHAEELSAPLVLLSGGGRALMMERQGAWNLVDQKDLEALRYPHPNDAPGLLCQLRPLDEQPVWLNELPLVDQLARARSPGEPVLTSWSRLMERRQEGADPWTARTMTDRRDEQAGSRTQPRRSDRTDPMARKPGRPTSEK